MQVLSPSFMAPRRLTSLSSPIPIGILIGRDQEPFISASTRMRQISLRRICLLLILKSSSSSPRDKPMTLWTHSTTSLRSRCVLPPLPSSSATPWTSTTSIRPDPRLTPWRAESPVMSWKLMILLELELSRDTSLDKTLAVSQLTTTMMWQKWRESRNAARILSTQSMVTLMKMVRKWRSVSSKAASQLRCQSLPRIDLPMEAVFRLLTSLVHRPLQRALECLQTLQDAKTRWLLIAWIPRLFTVLNLALSWRDQRLIVKEILSLVTTRCQAGPNFKTLTTLIALPRRKMLLQRRLPAPH